MKFPSPRLLAVFASAALLCPAAPLAAKGPANPSTRWEPEIAAYETANRKNPPLKGGIVFVGSSSIRLWKTLAEDFPDHRVVNRGFGGSQLADSTRFADRLVVALRPRQVILYAGSNDINDGKSPEQVFSDFKSFVAKVREKLPGAEIDYISIAGNPARWQQVEKVKAANGMIEAYIKEQPNMQFIDVFTPMLGPDGLPRPNIFVADQLHMNAEGYKIWAKVIAQYLSPEK